MYANESYVLDHLSQVLKICMRNRVVYLYANESQKRLNVRKRVSSSHLYRSHPLASKGVNNSNSPSVTDPVDFFFGEGGS